MRIMSTPSLSSRISLRRPAFGCLAGVVLLFAACLSPARAAEEPADPASRQYAAAAALQNRGVFDLAADEWTKFIKNFAADGRVDRAYHYLGVCLLQTKKPDRAAEAFQTVVDKHPKSESAEMSYLYLGIAKYTLGQSGKAEAFDEAAGVFAQQLEKFPDGKQTAQALFYWGECLYARGKKAEAVAKYRQLVAKAPSSGLMPDALYALGVAQQELEQFDAAAATFGAFLDKFPENGLATEVTMRRGEALLGAKKYDEALRWLAKAADKEGFPMADYATVRKAVALAQQGKPVDAAAVYASVAVKFPESKYAAPAQLSGGKCLFSAGQWAAARDLLAKAAAQDALAAEADHWLAQCWMKEKNPAKALDAAKKGLTKSDDPALLVPLKMDAADAMYELPGMRRAAIVAYAELAEKHAQHALAAQARYMAALAALQESDYAAGLKHAQAFRKRHASDKLAPDVQYVEAECQLQLGHPAEARKLYVDLLKKHPKHAEAETWQVREGLALVTEKQYEAAIKTLVPLVPKLLAPRLIAEAQHLIGTSEAELGRFDDAVRSLETAVKVDPKRPHRDETLLTAANAYRQKNEIPKAMSVLRQLIGEHPQSGLLDRAHYRLGEYAYATADYKTAAGEYETVVQQWPTSPLAPNAWYGLAWSRLNLADYAGTQSAVESLLAKFPNDSLAPRARYARGLARQQSQQYAPAILDFAAFLTSKTPAGERSDARYAMALSQVGLEKQADAAATLKKLLEDDPKYAAADKVLYEWAWAEKAQKKEKEAAELFARLAGQHPNSPLAAESLYHAAEYAYQKGDYRQAGPTYRASRDAAGQTPLGEKAAYRLAWCHWRLEELVEAAAAFKQQREKWPSAALSGNAAFMQAECCFRLGKHAEALEAYQQVKDPSGKDFALLALLHAAQSAAQLKQWDKSLALSARAAKEYPQSDYLPEILYEQGWATQNLGKLDEAVALYEQAVAKTDREVAARAQFMIGEIQFQQKKHAEAVKTFFKVAYGYGYAQWQADATYEAARCLEVLKKPDQAKKLYRELIDKFPKSDKAEVVRDRLKQLEPRSK